MKWYIPPEVSILALRGMKAPYQTLIGVGTYIFMDVTFSCPDSRTVPLGHSNRQPGRLSLKKKPFLDATKGFLKFSNERRPAKTKQSLQTFK
jgi:hypothetical protein